MTVSWTAHPEDGFLLVATYRPPDSQSLCRVFSPETPITIAAFDLDETIIRTKSRQPYFEEPEDWEWRDPLVVDRLKALHEEQLHQIVIITNQGRLTNRHGKPMPDLERFKRRVELILPQLGVPLTLYAACGNDKYRKPRCGIWQLIESEFSQQGRKVDTEGCFMVGDAAGRPTDHSDADFHFSLNVGLRFLTPEQYFLDGDKETGANGSIGYHHFDPTDFCATVTGDGAPREGPDENERAIADVLQESGNIMFVLVGKPGSGKSFFNRRVLQRLLGQRKCATMDPEKHTAEEIEGLLDRCASDIQVVVVDTINHTSDLRQNWLSLATKHGFRPVCLYFDASDSLCLHNDAVRAFSGCRALNPENKRVFHRRTFKRISGELQVPSEKEGFERIISVPFRWMGTAGEAKVWRRYWH